MTRSNTITITCFLLLESFLFSSFAQDSDNKIVISHKEEVYTYEFNKNGEVQISAEHVINYKSIKSSTVSFVEFYDADSEINNLKIKGVKGVSPKYGMSPPKNTFFSDNKACYFDIPLLKKDSEATVTYSKLYKNIRQFIFLTLAENYYTNSRTIRFVIPDKIGIDILTQNVSENTIISTVKDDINKTTTTIINIKNQPEYIFEEDAPHYMYSEPYIMIIPRESSGKKGDVRYFKTMVDLYQWYKNPLLQMNNDLPQIKDKALELTKNSVSDQERISELYKYVQQNIRYLAVSNGILAYKPDDAQNVIAKKYGDCKGMSNLLKSLLVSIGFDARLVWVATTDTERNLNIKNPIPFANHMICALYRNDSLYYFDPTVESLVFGEIPEQLQGQKALIEDGDNYIVSQIPQYSASCNRDSLSIQYSIVDNRLMGKASWSFKGESKYSVSYWVKSLQEAEKIYKIEESLRSRRDNDSIFDIQIKGLESVLPEVNLAYQINRKSNIRMFGNQMYINLNEIKDYENAKIDTEKRKTALQYPYKEYMIRESEFIIPEGYEVTQLPPNVDIQRNKYSYSIVYKKEKGKIMYHRKIFISDPIFEKTDFKQWNSDIDTLRNAYGELVVLEKR